MDMVFMVIAQIFGLAGMAAMLASFQTNRKQKLLNLQILSCVFYICQYLFLGAFSGCFMNLVALIRNFLYSRFKTVPRYLVVIVIFVVVLFAIFTFDGPLSLLPCFATIIFTVALTSKNLTIVRIADVISCVLYLIYNLSVGAYTGELATLAELTSTLIAMYRFDRNKARTKLRKIPHRK